MYLLLWTRVNTAAASPAHGLGMGSLTMGGRQQVYRKYERYQSERVDGASCLCSDDVTMMVSDGGEVSSSDGQAGRTTSSPH